MTSSAVLLKSTIRSISFYGSMEASGESGRHPEAELAIEEATKESRFPPKKKCRRDCHFDPKWIKEFKESLAAPRVSIKL